MVETLESIPVVKITDDKEANAKVLKSLDKIEVINYDMNPATDNEKTKKQITEGFY